MKVCYVKGMLTLRQSSSTTEQHSAELIMHRNTHRFD